MKRYFVGILSCMVLFGVILFAPSRGLHAQSGGSAHAITLTWSAPKTGGVPTTYNILRGTSSGSETALALVTAPNLTYVDSSGVGGTTYYYEVNASNSGGTSGPSNEVSATFLVSAPGAPSGLAAVSN